MQLMSVLNTLLSKLASSLVQCALLHRTTLLWFIMRWQQTHTKSKLYHRMKCRYCTVYSHISLYWGSEVCHALPTICLTLQGLCMCFRCSKASHVFHISRLPANNLLMQFTSPLSSFTHTISTDSIFLYLYFPFVWQFMASHNATSLHWPKHCTEDINLHHMEDMQVRMWDMSM